MHRPHPVAPTGSGALVQFYGNRTVIERSRQIGLCLSYVIDPINSKMRAMTWHFCDLSARYATPLTYNIIPPILQRIMVAVLLTNVLPVRSIGTGSVSWEYFCLLKSSLMPFGGGKLHARIAASRARPKPQQELRGWENGHEENGVPSHRQVKAAAILG
jgi:hypothetical protein